MKKETIPPEDSKHVVYDQWLSDIVGRPVYRILADEEFIRGSGRDAIAALQSKTVFLYAKVPVDSAARIEFLEQLQFRLVDTNIILEKPVSAVSVHTATAVGTEAVPRLLHSARMRRGSDPKGRPLTEDAPGGNSEVRFAEARDRDAVVMLARQSFQFSRFHLDTSFSREIANTIKAEWTANYFSGKRGTGMVVATIDKCIKGFLLLIEDKAGLLTIDLIAVDSECRQKGIASDMIVYVQRNCAGARQIRAGTQLANVPSLRLYEKMGFRVAEASYVFHHHS